MMLRDALLDGLPIRHFAPPIEGDGSSVRAPGAQDFAEILVFFAEMAGFSRWIWER